MELINPTLETAHPPATTIRRLGSCVLGKAIEATSAVRHAIATTVSPELADDARLAYIDHKTGLPNERAMDKQFEKLVAEGKPFAVILLDLNDFKHLNTSLGHAFADDILLQFADGLNTFTRDEDRSYYGTQAFRPGGDEFMILAPLESREEVYDGTNSVEPEMSPAKRLEAFLDRITSEYLHETILEDPSGARVSVSATASGTVVDPSSVVTVESQSVINELSQTMTQMKIDRRAGNH